MADTPFYLQQDAEPVGLTQAPQIPVETQPELVEEPVQVSAGAPDTIPLFSLKSNAVVDVPWDQAETLIRSGLFAPKKGTNFIVKNELGELFDTTGDNLVDVLKAGNTLENFEEKRAREVEERYGNQELAAGIEGAARMASFGLSDQFLTKVAGVSPEVLAGRKEANPVASIAGEIAGVAAGLFTGSTEAKAVTEGSKVASKIAKAFGAPQRAAGNIALKAEQAVAKKLTKDGLQKSVAAGIAAKAVGGAVEGSLYATGNLISEDALGTAEFNAENLVGYAGLGALVGGTLGATIGAGMAALPKVKQAAAPIQRLADEYTNEEKAALDLLGFTPATIAKAEQRNPGFAAEMKTFLRDDVLKGTTKTTEEIAERIGQIKTVSGAEIPAIAKAADDILIDSAALPTRQELFRNLAQKVDDTFRAAAEKSPELRLVRNKIDDYYNELIKASSDVSKVGAQELHALRMAADDLAKFEKLPGATNPMEKVARMARDYYNQELKNVIKTASEFGNNPALMTNFERANKLYRLSAETYPKALKAAARNPRFTLMDAVVTAASVGSLGPGGLAIIGAKKFLDSDFRRNLVVLGKIEKAQQSIAKGIRTSVDNFFSPAAKTLKPVIVKNLSSTAFGASESGKKPKNEQEAYNNFLNKAGMYAQDPEKYLERINRTTSLMQSGAPQTAAAVDALSVTGMKFLYDKLPKRNVKNNLLDVLKPVTLPSNFEMAKFNRYLTAVDSPMSVVEDLERGTVTKEGIEALKTVYPSLYSEVRNQIVKKIEKEGSNLSYNKKLQLGMFFDLVTDESMVAENVIGLQSNFQTQEPPLQGTNVGNIGKSEKANSMSSETEKIEDAND